MVDFFKEAASRLTKQTPLFFRKLGNVGIAAAAGGGALISPEVAGAHMPSIVIKIGGHLLTIGAVIKAVSHFAVVDPSDLNSNLPDSNNQDKDKPAGS